MNVEAATFASVVEDGRCLVAIAGELDIASASRAFVSLMAAVNGGHTLVSVDCAKLSFLDAAGLASLIAAARRAKMVGVAFALVNVQPLVALVIDVTGMGLLLGVAAAGPPGR